eukprot:CAMPEP_0179012730 /NCGR_PEP_ID=MMETSP0796-20121207/1356_1 /TAXON_ID=73915 /ORGANISM="Pyrodinium bahamense, Strain pbaha01" /LENGTH=151 /DNA_ID=CAMNT_0020708201 /DNA_START=469 /DNA_END=925 /DNA_ORIENTATION=+
MRAARLIRRTHPAAGDGVPSPLAAGWVSPSARCRPHELRPSAVRVHDPGLVPRKAQRAALEALLVDDAVARTQPVGVPAPMVADMAQATSTSEPRLQTCADTPGSVNPSAPCANPGGGLPAPEYECGPPPATPQPDPNTGARPGARHGDVR